MPATQPPLVSLKAADTPLGTPLLPHPATKQLDDAFHEQTILAWELNGAPVPVENGAPLRARIERQLGYKQPKYLQRIELVSSFADLAGGKGGYWEDQGYNWYGGI